MEEGQPLVWSIRATLQFGLRLRDLALFTLAIDSKLCDLVDCASRMWRLTATQSTTPNVRQKTGRPVRFELSEQTRQLLDHGCAQRSQAGAVLLRNEAAQIDI